MSVPLLRVARVVYAPEPDIERVIDVMREADRAESLLFVELAGLFNDLTRRGDCHTAARLNHAMARYFGGSKEVA